MMTRHPPYSKQSSSDVACTSGWFITSHHFCEKIINIYLKFQNILEVARKRKWKLICVGFFSLLTRSNNSNHLRILPCACIPINVTDVVERVLVFLEVTSFLTQDTRRCFFLVRKRHRKTKRLLAGAIFLTKERHWDMFLFCYII